MKQYDFIISTEADDDITAAFRWYETQELGLGELFLARLDETVARLRAYPRAGREITPEVRRLLVNVFPYNVYYTIDDENCRIKVPGVRHTHRFPERW